MSVKELKEIYENGFILEFDDNDKIDSEVISPLDALRTADNFLKSKGIRIDKLDMKDWSLSDIKYEEINENSK